LSVVLDDGFWALNICSRLMPMTQSESEHDGKATANNTNNNVYRQQVMNDIHRLPLGSYACRPRRSAHAL